ncbi:GNAT family N-acetyltransferase [Halobacillus massiliensis]|uniref:GNAT family N-acetyltransferase n=1 Tax=Halobacillus massiliensis TaxID=1926286 RepID=UPI001FED191F|nr:GNAT family N-acetyltransferase [Halobacillus massiliensis]
MKDPVIKEYESIHLVGFRVLCEGSEYVHEIPKAAEKLDQRISEIPRLKKPALQIGAFKVKETSAEEDGYWVCYQVESYDKVPEGMVSLTIPAQAYAVYRVTGANTKIPQAYEHIHQWMEQEGYPRLLDHWHLEKYFRSGRADDIDVELMDTTKVDRTSSITFNYMSSKMFGEYAAANQRKYAEELYKSERFSTFEEALAHARNQFADLLPEGTLTKDHHLFTLKTDLIEDAGVLWVHTFMENEEAILFIYDIEIVESLRGQGFGKAAMKAVEEFAIKQKAKKIKLHVFDHNVRARSLYEKLGYVAEGRNMVKDLQG